MPEVAVITTQYNQPTSTGTLQVCDCVANSYNFKSNQNRVLEVPTITTQMIVNKSYMVLMPRKKRTTMAIYTPIVEHIIAELLTRS